MPCTPNCGACCDPVSLPETQALKIFGALEHNIGPQADQLYDLWSPIGPSASDPDSVLFRCAAYDVASRSCTEYDDRPPVCSGFPWYGKEPNEAKIPARSVCGYQAELGRTVLPLVQVT